jgi:hypothetical protein
VFWRIYRLTRYSPENAQNAYRAAETEGNTSSQAAAVRVLLTDIQTDIAA